MNEPQRPEITEATCATNTEMTEAINAKSFDENNNDTDEPASMQMAQERTTLDACRKDVAAAGIMLNGTSLQEHCSEQFQNASIPSDQVADMVSGCVAPVPSGDSSIGYGQAKQAYWIDNMDVKSLVQSISQAGIHLSNNDVKLRSGEIPSDMMSNLTGSTAVTLDTNNNMIIAATESLQFQANGALTAEPIQSTLHSDVPLHDNPPSINDNVINMVTQCMLDKEFLSDVSPDVQKSAFILKYIDDLTKFTKQCRVPKSSFVPKLNPSQMYRGRGGARRRPRKSPYVDPSSNLNYRVSIAGANNGFELPSDANFAHLQSPVQNNLSEDQLFDISGKPLRKLAPKQSDGQLTNQQTVIPMILPTTPIAFPMTSAVPTFDAASCNVPFSAVPLQDHPLDLCTKISPSNSIVSSPPSSPYSADTEEAPLDLSTNQSRSYENPKPQLQQCQPRHLSRNLWQTPLGPITPDRRQSGGPSSPLGGGMVSDTAVTSPGINSHKLSMSSMESVSQTNVLPKDLPEGTVAMPGPIRHYKLTKQQACQHNEPPTSERPYMCHVCGATFKRNKSLQQHHRVHLPQKFYDHEKEDYQHSEPKQEASYFPCEACPRTFTHFSHLKSHARVHRPHNVQQLSSPGPFSNDSNLMKHEELNSFEPKPYTCPYCPLRFKYSGDVKRHVRVHTGEKPYVCGYCKMRFTQSNTLKQHERTHTGERPYACHKCDMKFTQSGSLKYHLAHRHPKDVQTIFITNMPNVNNSPTQTLPLGFQVISMNNPIMGS